MEATSKHSHSFVPALGHDWLTPLYDPLIRLTLREQALKQRLVDQAAVQPGMRVLDFGCGTATLTLLLKRSQPTAMVVGLDIDPKVLHIAERKIEKAQSDVQLVRGTLSEAGFAPESFDRVVTCLVLHHLAEEEKLAAFSGMREVLRPGGELHIGDFGPPHNTVMKLVSWPVRFLDGSDRVGPNLTGRLPALMREAGFADVRERGSAMTAFGTLAFWSAVR